MPSVYIYMSDSEFVFGGPYAPPAYSSSSEVEDTESEQKAESKSEGKKTVEAKPVDM